jgi:hypothetical protein
MAASSKPDIIRAIFAAYLSNDRSAVEEFLADDFRFTSPYDDGIDKATYFALAKGGKSFRNTEFFTFAGDRVKRIDVYFGAAYENGAFVRQSES